MCETHCAWRTGGEFTTRRYCGEGRTTVRETVGLNVVHCIYRDASHVRIRSGTMRSYSLCIGSATVNEIAFSTAGPWPFRYPIASPPMLLHVAEVQYITSCYHLVQSSRKDDLAPIASTILYFLPQAQLYKQLNVYIQQQVQTTPTPANCKQATHKFHHMTRIHSSTLHAPLLYVSVSVSHPSSKHPYPSYSAFSSSPPHHSPSRTLKHHSRPAMLSSYPVYAP